MASCTAVVASDYDLQAHGATVDMVHGFIAWMQMQPRNPHQQICNDKMSSWNDSQIQIPTEIVPSASIE